MVTLCGIPTPQSFLRVSLVSPHSPSRTTRDSQRDTVEAAAEAAQAQFSNMEAAMRQQLSQFRANASSEGSLTDDVMGQLPLPSRPPDGSARPSECTLE